MRLTTSRLRRWLSSRIVRRSSSRYSSENGTPCSRRLDALAVIEARGVRRSCVTEENSAARMRLASASTRARDAASASRIPLDVEECFDRNIGRTVREYVDRLKSPDAEITVILPRREYPRLRQRLLHDRTSRTIARALLDEPHVDVVAVPYHLHGRASSRSEQRRPRRPQPVR
jgi:hypothetical protein